MKRLFDNRLYFTDNGRCTLREAVTQVAEGLVWFLFILSLVVHLNSWVPKAPLYLCISVLLGLLSSRNLSSWGLRQVTGMKPGGSTQVIC